MKKLTIIFLILFLILTTTLVKNSTKRTNDEIFGIEENIRSLKKDFQNIRLEHEYLSSSDQLLEFKRLYFDDELVKKDIQEMRTINQNLKKLKIEKLKIINE